MSYKAIIARIKNVRTFGLDEKGKLKADKLKLGTCYGSQVIVDLNTIEGQWGIYFATDGQLNDEFAKANDLIRRKDENGKPAGGMFDHNKKVRTQKFRGEVSDGFWIPIESLSYIGKVEIDSDHVHLGLHVFKEGDEIESIDGHVLCNKYVTQKTKNATANLNGPKGKKKFGSQMFHEHFDTPQFGRNIDKIQYGVPIIVTEKLHGCVDGNTIIDTLDHGCMSIKEIVDKKLKCKVRAFDIETNNIVYVDIDDYYYYPNDGDWYEIELEDGSKIEITGNNPVWLPEINSYRRVDELVENDILLKD